MSGNFDDNEFENIENEPENIDDLYEKIDLDSIEAEIEAISQDQKSAYFFGSVDQSKFYKYLEENIIFFTKNQTKDILNTKIISKDTFHLTNERKFFQIFVLKKESLHGSSPSPGK